MAAAIVAGAAHGLLLWLLATKLLPELPQQAEAANGAGLSIFDVVEVAVPAAAAPPPEATPSASSDVDATSETTLPPPEWSIVRLTAASQAARPRARTVPNASSGEAAPSGGGSADPFAGAARLPTLREASQAAAEAPDPIVLRQVVSSVSRASRPMQGSADFAVHVSPSGIVVDARILGGTAPDAVKAALRRALIGARLFPPQPVAAGSDDHRILSIALP